MRTPDCGSSPPPTRESRGWLRAAGFAAAGVALFLLARLTASGEGICWDEAYYYPAYRDAGAWCRELFSSPGAALSADGIAVGWSRIHELPPVAKWLGALCLALSPGGAGDLGAMRSFPAAAYAGAVLLVFAIARRWTRSDAAATVAALAYASHPVVFGNAHFAATESAFAFVTLAALWLAFRLREAGFKPWAEGAILGVAMGVAFATKANGIVLDGLLALWLLLGEPGAWRRGLVRAAAATGVALAVAFALWPWMWHDTVARFVEYADFIRHHSHQGVWYLGRKWNFQAPLAPWHYPLIMVSVCSPEPFILLALGGLALVARRARSDAFGLLVAATALVPLAAAMLPGAPKYDGLRLVFPVLGPLAVIGSAAVARVHRRGRRCHTTDDSPVSWLTAFAGTVLVLGCSVPFLGQGIDFYNVTTRLVSPKGDEFPFETTYWGQAIDRRVLGALNEALPPDARVLTRGIHNASLELAQEWGMLRSDIRYVEEPPCDAHLVQNRKGFWGQADWWLRANREPLLEWPSAGEPKVILYDGRPVGQ